MSRARESNGGNMGTTVTEQQKIKTNKYKYRQRNVCLWFGFGHTLRKTGERQLWGNVETGKKPLYFTLMQGQSML